MSSQSSGGAPVVEKPDNPHHPESSIQQSQPIDLRGPSVVQLRPVRAFGSLSHHQIGKSMVATAVGSPSIISVNRGNLAILPTRGTTGQTNSAQGIPTTYQIARGAVIGNVRATTHGPPASITVTPISASGFGQNIRLTGTTVNNGSWIQTNNPQGAFAPIRATTITVSGRAIRPDGKMIHIPQQGSVQHLAQLQMVDNKGSILKPQIGSPIVNMRGTIQAPGSTNSGTSLTLPLHPFTIRAANITNLPIQQRPPISSTANQVQKVISQPIHGSPIQLINKLPGHTLQTITPIPRLNCSTVCLTITTNGKAITPNNSNPIVAMSSRPSLIMTPSLTNSQTGVPITKVYPVGRDGDTIFPIPASHSGQTGGQVQNTVTSNSLSGPTQLLVHGPINVGLTSSNTVGSFYLDQKNVIQTRPIAVDSTGKRILDTKVSNATFMTSPMIISGQSQSGQAVTIPIGGSLHGFANQITPISHGQHSILTPHHTTHLLTQGGSQLHAIPAHVISQQQQSTSLANSTSASSGTSSLTTTSVVPSSQPLTTGAGNTTPVQSPSQTGKSTLSPRPSILRKRGEILDHGTPLRAQRNLALNFNSSTSASGLAASAAAAANKENAIVAEKPSPTMAGLSILKKEFQPPNEESCSSNSSSGSTTISTTSETAELQMQQQQLTQAPVLSVVQSRETPAELLNLNVSSSSGPNVGPPSSGSSNSHNGILPTSRPVVNVLRKNQGGKMTSKELERVKGAIKGKEESVSPRKKPRKQQLTTSDLLESSSPEISFYQGKRFKRSDIMDPTMFKGFSEKSFPVDPVVEEPPAPKTVVIVNKPHMSLLPTNKPVVKLRQNHFQRYSDVKSKEERRPTVNELANQKNIIQKVGGWKVQSLSNQLDMVVDLEANVVSGFNNLLETLDAKVGANASDRDLNRIQELLKGNIQRCKVIRDQMTESRSQVSNILKHKQRVMDVINKYVSKRPIKKRERT